MIDARPSRPLVPGDERLPQGLTPEARRDLADGLTVVGNRHLLKAELVALFTSIRTPPDLILPGFDLVKQLRNLGIPVIGGFQTPLERQWLRILLRGRQPVVVCLARGIVALRLTREWRNALEEERLVIVSAEAARVRRPTIRETVRRNRVVATLAERLLIVHARVGSRAFRAAAHALELGREVYCMEHPRNADLALIGATPLRPDPLIRALKPASLASRS